MSEKLLSVAVSKNFALFIRFVNKYSWDVCPVKFKIGLQTINRITFSLSQGLGFNEMIDKQGIELHE